MTTAQLQAFVRRCFTAQELAFLLDGNASFASQYHSLSSFEDAEALIRTGSDLIDAATTNLAKLPSVLPKPPLS